MTKAEMLLKVMMSHHEPAKVFIDNYLRLLSDSPDIGEFQKVLEMKGLKRSEISSLVDMYRAHMPVSMAIGRQGSDTLTHTQASTATSTPEPESSRIRKLEKLIKKRL
ncbi:hypothetical protein DPMN_178959 [Dreissena polymorpha]|uniref:Vps53 C-terminal domain-containing protein n=2 Tax=Dreissena polymorpha TaxID=45954 RepID=A0A9D4EG87_DREPO|nr:hypothetical protein DPMN_178959 [Dreissena polymorpha]